MHVMRGELRSLFENRLPRRQRPRLPHLRPLRAPREVHAARGRHAEAVEFVAQVYRSLAAWGMHEEGLAALLLALRSLREQGAQAGVFRELAAYLRRAWHRPRSG